MYVFLTFYQVLANALQLFRKFEISEKHAFNWYLYFINVVAVNIVLGAQMNILNPKTNSWVDKLELLKFLTFFIRIRIFINGYTFHGFLYKPISEKVTYKHHLSKFDDVRKFTIEFW